MQKVSVIGCPGAGKTTFSKELARRTNLPLVHLDRMYHDETYDYQTNKESWRGRVTKETSKKRWIIDGNYKSTFDIRLPKSDTIIFLDYPTHVSLWRAMKRRVQFRKKVRDDMPRTWRERLGWSFFWFIVKFNYSVAPEIRQLLAGLNDMTVIVFRSPRDTAEYIRTISLEQQDYSA